MNLYNIHIEYVGTSSNGVSYRKSDVECHGEVKNTNVNCAGLTSSVNNPIVTKYDLLPIWQIKNLSFSDETTTNFTIFYMKILETLADCSNVLCRGIFIYLYIYIHNPLHTMEMLRYYK